MIPFDDAAVFCAMLSLTCWGAALLAWFLPDSDIPTGLGLRAFIVGLAFSTLTSVLGRDGIAAIIVALSCVCFIAMNYASIQDEPRPLGSDQLDRSESRSMFIAVTTVEYLCIARCLVYWPFDERGMTMIMGMGVVVLCCLIIQATIVFPVTIKTRDKS